jgi:RNA polymerase sigma-70 factor (ECF subfamily)
LDRLYRFAMAVTRSEADARDAVQDACILAWRQLPTLREPDRFDAWLDQIVVNSARMVVRRTNRIRVRELSSGGAADPRDEGRSRVPEPSTPAATDGVADGELIRRAFGRLDGDARTLLVLHHVEGVPVAEIARRSGSPVGTVKWRLSRARAALERALEVERR